MEVACGQCIGCRVDRSKQWALRCTHEAKQHDQNAFITFTYDPEHLPVTGSLRPRDFRNFMKRLRKHIYPNKVRYFQCGEYGEGLQRPHHHAILFGYEFPDRVPYKRNAQGDMIYTSELCDKIWSHGLTFHGSATFKSAGYISRYIMKKRNGDEAQNHYARIHPETGEIFYLQPEYITMSRRPGIGKEWFDKYVKDTYKDDFVIHDGRKHMPPTYYDKELERYDSELFHIVKTNRKRNALLTADNATPDRLRVRETVLKSRLSQLKRD